MVSKSLVAHEDSYLSSLPDHPEVEEPQMLLASINSDHLNEPAAAVR